MLPPAVRDRISLHRSKRVVSAACLALLLIATAPATAAPLLTLSPSTLNVTPGSTFTIDVLASDVDDLLFFQIGIRYDTEVFQGLAMSPGSIQLSPPLEPLPSPDNNFDLENHVGEAFYFDIGADAGIDLNGSLLRVTFGALLLPAGATSVSSFISFFIGEESQGYGLFDSSFNAIPIDAVEPVAITVAAEPVSVPEPSTLSIFASGLAMFGSASLWRRRRLGTS